MASLSARIAVRQVASGVRRQRLRAGMVPRLRGLFADLLAPELTEIRERIGEAREAGDWDIVQSWIDAFYPDNAARVRAEMLPVIASFGGDVVQAAAAEIDMDPEDVGVEEFAEEYAEAFAARWTSDSIAPVRAALRDLEGEELDESLDVELQAWEEARPGWVAEREATQMGGAFASLAYVAGGITRLVWRANFGACDLCQAMDGRLAEIRGSFLSPGDVVQAGSEASGDMPVDRIIRHPPLHGNHGKGGVCQCFVAAGL